MGCHQANRLWAACCLVLGVMAIPAVLGQEVPELYRGGESEGEVLNATHVVDYTGKWTFSMPQAAQDVPCGTTVDLSWSSGNHDVALVQGGELPRQAVWWHFCLLVFAWHTRKEKPASKRCYDCSIWHCQSLVLLFASLVVAAW